MKSLSWEHVFNCRNVFPEPFYKCLERAKSVGYDYMAFNGRVYDVNQSIRNKSFEEIGLESDLDKPVTVVNNHTVITDKPQSEIDFLKRIKKISEDLQDSLNGRGR